MHRSALSQPGLSKSAVEFYPSQLGQLRYQTHGHSNLTMHASLQSHSAVLDRLDFRDECALICRAWQNAWILETGSFFVCSGGADLAMTQAAEAPMGVINMAINRGLSLSLVIRD